MSLVPRIAAFAFAFAALSPRLGSAQPAACPAHLATIEPDGRVSAGSREAVRAAVAGGLPLRIGWELDVTGDRVAEIRHWAEAGFVSEFEGEVFAQVDDIQAQRPRRAPARMPMPAGRKRWSGLLGTNGLLESHLDDGTEPKAVPVRGIWCVDPRVAACVTPQWRLVYQHDVEGRPVAGSKEALFDALRRGQPLRLAWGFSAERAGRRLTLEHSAEPEFVSLIDGEELIVQLPEHVAQASYADRERATFEKGSVMWRGILRTSGVFDALWVDRATGEEVRRFPQRARIAWFALAPDPACAPPPVALAVEGGVVRR